MGEHKCEWAYRANGLQTSQEGVVRRREATRAKHQEMWTTLSDVRMTMGTCGRQATGLTFTHSTQTLWQRLWAWAHTTNKYYTQQRGWMKSEDDEKKPMTREI